MATSVVQVRGLDALHQRLKPGMLFRPVTKEIIEAAARAAHLTARRAAKGRAGKGSLGRAITMEYERTWKLQDSAATGPRGPFAAIIYPHRSISGIASTIEYGRRSGRRPPYGPIKRWLIAANIIPAGKGTSKRIREVQEQIRLCGTKGIGYMKAAEDVANKVIRGNLPRTEAEIKALWERPS